MWLFCVRIRLFRTFVNGFCACCANFVYVYGFLCVLIEFCVRIRLSFAMFDADRIEGSDLAGFFICFSLVNTRDSLTVSRIRYWGFRQVLFPRELLVIIGPSQGSDLEGSAEFFFRARFLLLLNPIKDPILRVLLSSFYDKLLMIYRTIIPWRFLFWSW